MIYPGFYHFMKGHQKGKEKNSIKYFADPQNQAKRIIKQQRKPNFKLIVAPFPELQRGAEKKLFSNLFYPIFLTKDL